MRSDIRWTKQNRIACDELNRLMQDVACLNNGNRMIENLQSVIRRAKKQLGTLDKPGFATRLQHDWQKQAREKSESRGTA